MEELIPDEMVTSESTEQSNEKHEVAAITYADLTYADHFFSAATSAQPSCVQHRLKEHNRLLSQGRFEVLQLEVRALLCDDYAMSSDLMSLIHSYADQGRIAEALALCKNEALRRTDIVLTEHFLKAFVSGDPGRCIETLESFIPELIDQPSFLAIALDLLGRAQLLAIEWNLAGPALMIEAQNNLHRAALKYRGVGELAREYECVRALAQVYLSGRCANLTLAISLSEYLERVARMLEDPIRLAHARLIRWDALLRECPPLDSDTPTNLLRSLDAQDILTLFREGGYLFGEADVLTTLGLVFLHREAAEDAENLLGKALDHYEAFGFAKGAFHVALQIASLRQDRQQAAQAIESCTTALKHSTKTGCGLFTVMAQAHRAHLYLALGHTEEGSVDLASVLELSTTNPAVYAVSGVNIAALGLMLGKYEQAKECSQRTVRLLTKLGSSPALSRALLVEGNTLAAMRDWEGALRSWKKGTKVDQRLGDRVAEQEKMVAMAQGTALAGQPEQLPERYDEALQILKGARLIAGRLRAPQQSNAFATIEEVEGQIHVMFRKHLDAIRAFERARTAYLTLGCDLQVAHCDLYLGACYFELGRLHQNPELFNNAALFQEASISGFRKASAREALWKALYQRAITSIRNGLLQVVRQSKIHLWLEGAKWLDDAAKIVESLPPSAVFVEEQSKIFHLGTELFRDLLHDDRKTVQWAERERRFRGLVVDGPTTTKETTFEERRQIRRASRIRREPIPKILH